MNPGSWVAVDASTDLRDQALRLSRIHHAAASGDGSPPAGLRDPVRRSWRRCAQAGFDLERPTAPVAINSDEAAERWRSHPLSIAEPVLRELLADVHSDDDQVVLACDADGALLWIDGEPAVLDAAHEIHLEPGAMWSEPAAGTNAMGTALAVEHPIQIFSAEHLAEPVHGWTCSAAPVHDPRNGELLGVIDLSGEVATAHPHSLALVTAAARVVETELAQRGFADGSSLGSHDGALRLQALGRRRMRVEVGRGPTELSHRHSEIVVLLILHPGLDDERLARELYGADGLAGTARAELSRLRKILGDRLPAGERRLLGRVHADFTAFEEALDRGSPAEALDRYPGPLLPGSRVPLVAEARERLELRLRDALRARPGPALLKRWLQTAPGRDDIDLARELVRRLESDDPAHAGAATRLRRLSRADDLA
jgi:GAF domain